MGESLFQVEMLCHLHKPWLDYRLNELVQACAQADSEASISDLSSTLEDLRHEGLRDFRDSAKLPKSQKKRRRRIPALPGPFDWGEKKTENETVSAVIRIN